MAEQTGPVWYEIRVRGLLGKTLLGAFPGMCARAHEKETVLCGPVADQAALHGVLVSRERAILTSGYGSRTMVHGIDCEGGGSAAGS